MAFEFKYKFPCGLEVYEKVSFWAAIVGKFYVDMYRGCPLHGLKCRRK